MSPPSHANGRLKRLANTYWLPVFRLWGCVLQSRGRRCSKQRGRPPILIWLICAIIHGHRSLYPIIGVGVMVLVTSSPVVRVSCSPWSGRCMEYEADERPSADETRAWLEVTLFFMMLCSMITSVYVPEAQLNQSTAIYHSGQARHAGLGRHTRCAFNRWSFCPE